MPTPKRDYQLGRKRGVCVWVNVCFWGLLLKALHLQQPLFQFVLTFSCMASFQVFIPQFLQLNHSLLSVFACSLLFSLLEDMVSCSLFPVLPRMAPIPPIIPIVSQVPMAHQQKQWEGDSGTIHGTRMVFIFLTAMQSQCSCVFPFVWPSRRKTKKRGKKGQRWLKRGMELLNKTAVRKSRQIPFCFITKSPLFIPLTFSASNGDLKSSSFLAVIKKNSFTSASNTPIACAPSLLWNSILMISIKSKLFSHAVVNYQ